MKGLKIAFTNPDTSPLTTPSTPGAGGVGTAVDDTGVEAVNGGAATRRGAAVNEGPAVNEGGAVTRGAAVNEGAAVTRGAAVIGGGAVTRGEVVAASVAVTCVVAPDSAGLIVLGGGAVTGSEPIGFAELLDVEGAARLVGCGGLVVGVAAVLAVGEVLAVAALLEVCGPTVRAESSARARPSLHPLMRAAPIPKARAKAPTRPMYAALGMPNVYRRRSIGAPETEELPGLATFAGP